MDPNELDEMRAGGVSLMQGGWCQQGDIPDGDEEAAELRNSLLATADPQLIQDVAASLMSEDWFKKKLTEKISFLLTKKGDTANSTEGGHEQASVSADSRPLGLASAEDDDLSYEAGEAKIEIGLVSMERKMDGKSLQNEEHVGEQTTKVRFYMYKIK